ncbi:hypothetical protein BZA70DRAFT_290734 [Myxozyma melibiosi]|uniref:Uncharacterized protein n=1 Tax=Myxozyma melibiosi TaxID=54550 RepID=A0ABR1F2Z8_9ASCO
MSVLPQPNQGLHASEPDPQSYETSRLLLRDVTVPTQIPDAFNIGTPDPQLAQRAKNSAKASIEAHLTSLLDRKTGKSGFEDPALCHINYKLARGSSSLEIIKNSSLDPVRRLQDLRKGCFVENSLDEMRAKNLKFRWLCPVAQFSSSSLLYKKKLDIPDNARGLSNSQIYHRAMEFLNYLKESNFIVATSTISPIGIIIVIAITSRVNTSTSVKATTRVRDRQSHQIRDRQSHHGTDLIIIQDIGHQKSRLHCITISASEYKRAALKCAVQMLSNNPVLYGKYDNMPSYRPVIILEDLTMKL